MVWDNEKCILLIQLYKQKKILWNTKNVDYYNRNLKRGAWKKISAVLEEDINEVKKKMNSLLGSFRRERSREKRSLITGSATDSVYKSKWFAYEYLFFILDKDDPLDTTDTIITITEENPKSSSGVHIDDDSRNISTKQARVSTPATVPFVHRARKRKADPVCDEAMSILRQASQKSDDSFTSYGTYITNELKKHDSVTVANIKYAINNILYQADMGYYKTHNATKDHQHYPSPSNNSSRPSTETSQHSYVTTPPHNRLTTPPAHNDDDKMIIFN